MEEELKRETMNTGIQNATYYNVYRTSTELYAPENICEEYNVGSKTEKKEINEENYYLVTKDEIDIITNESKNRNTPLLPNTMILFDLKLVFSFNAFIDINHDRKIYIADNICTEYNITPISKRSIKGITYCQVTEDDLTTIENQPRNDNLKFKRNIIEVELEDEIKPAEKLFMFYTDSETRKHFINRDILELLRKNNIEIEGTPRVINDKNCYSITENELKEAEKTLHYHGIEQLLKPMTMNSQQINAPDEEQLKALTEQIYQFASREGLFRQARPYDEEKVESDVQQYLDRITPPINDKEIVNTFANSMEEKPIIIYRNKKSDRLYIPTEKENATITIMHKPCRKTDFNEIRELNQKVIIATVYISEAENYNITICNNNGQLFIAHSILSRLGFYLENPYRIIVNKEVYEEISQEDIELIKGLESDSCHINIVVKQIAPKRG